MRVTCISDTHGCHDDLRLGRGDLLIHAGDFSPSERVKPKSFMTSSFEDWIVQQRYDKIVLIAGNHDEDPAILSRLKAKGVDVLSDETTRFRGLNIYGSPWSPRHKPGRPQSAYKFDSSSDFGRQLRAQIPLDTHILVTHCPMFGLLDLTDKGEHIGCKELLYRRLQLKDLRLHVTGHVHEAGGYVTHYLNGKHSITVNASGCPAQYGYRPQPVYNLNLLD